ncbi:MAG: transposase family protein, partial [Acidobacteria bacterium]|nr:transposase family protein [Acidobacteriota bacterium]
MPMEEDAKSRLVFRLGQISDPRIERTKLHSLQDILVIAVLATICAAESYPEIAEFGRDKEEWRNCHFRATKTFAARTITNDPIHKENRKMLNQPTIHALRSLKLNGMADAYTQQLEQSEVQRLSFDERLALLVDRETTHRD